MRKMWMRRRMARLLAAAVVLMAAGTADGTPMSYVFEGTVTFVPSELASEFNIPLVDFLMEDVALNAELMQPDRIHPNARGNDLMLENVWAVLRTLL